MAVSMFALAITFFQVLTNIYPKLSGPENADRFALLIADSKYNSVVSILQQHRHVMPPCHMSLFSTRVLFIMLTGTVQIQYTVFEM